jgi:hypothetical protein
MRQVVNLAQGCVWQSPRALRRKTSERQCFRKSDGYASEALGALSRLRVFGIPTVATVADGLRRYQCRLLADIASNVKDVIPEDC